MTFGEDSGWGSSPAESESILSEYLQRGGNFIDTANIYTNGHSEKSSETSLHNVRPCAIEW
jgi:aryl-alcohol dehydrogenase-like predicted oxidoreductase